MREKVEDHYWSCDGLCEQYTQWFIIQFGDSDSDSGTDSSTSGEECSSQETYSACSDDTISDGHTSGEEFICSCDCG